ncbi:hypothetical protein Dip510_001650 [Elusimicrobium posterum]|uniref:hypothetical protein n=1 Tax=Elusimicrobium posterum TaxID=3116653 RepID=UPI003C75B637
MWPFNKVGKRDLDIHDAMVERTATIALGGKKLVLKELSFVDFLNFQAIMSEFSTKNIAAFLYENLGKLLKLCFPGNGIRTDKLTTRETLNFIIAFIEVNDLDRTLSNFQKATPTIREWLKTLGQAGSTLPK